MDRRSNLTWFETSCESAFMKVRAVRVILSSDLDPTLELDSGHFYRNQMLLAEKKLGTLHRND